ncbi:MAG: penicillin-binding transpeptidase domain-containing protein, partial [Clostridium sp.]
GTLGLIPPGSIFKSMTALVGLSEGVIDENTQMFDSGKYDNHKELHGFAPTCWKKSGHGSVDLVKSLQSSCNIFFYETGYRLYKNSGGDINALNKIAEYAWKFGLGVDPNGQGKKGTGIEIEENFGNVYNFETSKKDIAYFSKFQLANDLDSGNYNNGSAYFVPFDYSYSDDDSEELHIAKDELKGKIDERFMAIGTPMAINTDEFSRYIIKDVRKIMDISPKYKNNLTEYEKKHGKVNLENEAKKVSDIIAKFVCNDKQTEITSPAQLIYASIGQGTNNFTPIQLGGYISTLANGGTRYKLSLVDRVLDYDGNVIKEFEPEILDKIDIKEEHLALIKEGMSKANDAEGGTATAAFRGFPIQTAGKTGTADFTEDQAEWGREPFATYISFAPLDKPEIAFIGVIYDGGHGGWTAPVARAVYEEYFKEKLMSEYPGYTSNSFEKYVKNKEFN